MLHNEKLKIHVYKDNNSFQHYRSILFVCIEALHPSEQFSVMLGQSHCFLGVDHYSGELSLAQ